MCFPTSIAFMGFSLFLLFIQLNCILGGKEGESLCLAHNFEAEVRNGLLNGQSVWIIYPDEKKLCIT